MKKKLVIYAPVDSYSGYGAAARDKVRSLINLYNNEYEIGIISCNWGSLPLGFLKDHKENYQDFIDKIIGNTLNYQPDIMIWITVPNEVQKIGKINILFTAGIETTVFPGEWIEGVNKMDLTIMPSKHSKDIAINSIFKKIDQNTGQETELKINTPIEVIFEGVNTDVFKKLTTTNEFKDKTLFNNIKNLDIKNNGLYLFTGLWIGQNGNIDRKNITELILTFCQTFYNKKNSPGLLLKTSTSGCNYSDIERLKEKVNSIKSQLNLDENKLPNIFILHGDFTDQQMNEIYNHPSIKGMISLTRGEGFGRPLLEFTITGKPIIASGWSGHMDFLNTEQSLLVGGHLVQVHPSIANNMILKESFWFQPNLQNASQLLILLEKKYKEILSQSKTLGYNNKKNFSLLKMQNKIKEVFDTYIKVPNFIPINIPNLNNLPKLKKINNE